MNNNLKHHSFIKAKNIKFPLDKEKYLNKVVYAVVSWDAIQPKVSHKVLIKKIYNDAFQGFYKSKHKTSKTMYGPVILEGFFPYTNLLSIRIVTNQKGFKK